MNSTPDDSLLPGGMVLRRIKPSDLESACELIADRMTIGDVADLRSVVATNPENVVVVVDGDRVVSTLTLLDEMVSVGPAKHRVDIAAGQIELVATHTSHEKRGLVRALVGWAHDESLRRGHLMHVMLGIPHYYRQFGYEYTTKLPTPRVLSQVPPYGSGSLVRPATIDDVLAVVALTKIRQSTAEVVLERQLIAWTWVCDEASPARVYVSVRDGLVVGAARLRLDDGTVEVGELCGDVEPMLAFAATLGDDVVVYDVRDPEQSAELDLWCDEGQVEDWTYTRITDAAQLLEAMRPALTARLNASSLAGTSGCAKISWYRSAVEMDFVDGVFAQVRTVPSFQGFVGAGGSYFPPDALGRLLFGVDSVASIELRFPDAIVREQRELLDIIFPSVRSDLATWYLPEP